MKRIKSFFLVSLLLLIVLACSSQKEVVSMESRSAEELLQTGQQLAAAGEYDQAIDTFKRILIYHPTSDLHIDAQLKIAESYGFLEKYEEQFDQLLQLVRENNIPERVPDIYIQVARFFETAASFNPGDVTSASNDLEKAESYYRKAILYKDSDNMNSKNEAMYRLALTLAKSGKIDQAVEQYNLLVNNFPDSPFSILAQMKLQDPSDSSELATDDLSMQKYRVQLGLSPAPKEPETVKPQDNPVQEEHSPSDEPSLEESLFQSSKEEK